MEKLILVLALTFLSGCSSLHSMNPDHPDTIATHNRICSSYGLNFGTTNFASCMLSLRADMLRGRRGPNS